MNNSFKALSLQTLAVGAVVLLAQSAQCQQVLYNNTTSYQNANFNPAGGVTFGNEIVMAAGGAFDQVQSVAFQFDLTGTAAALSTESIDVKIFANNGSLINNAPSPSSVLWDSGTSTLASQGLAGFTQGSTLTYSVPNITTGSDFTLAVTFSNLQTGDSAGLGLYNPVTVGFNYDDAWVETGGTWALDKASSGAPYLFGMQVVGVTPEPSTLALGLMGLCGFMARFRKK